MDSYSSIIIGKNEFNKKFNAEISSKEKTILVKPQTFMNLSGEAVKNILNFYYNIEQIIIFNFWFNSIKAAYIKLT